MVPMAFAMRLFSSAIALLALGCSGTSDVERPPAPRDPGLPPGASRLVDLSGDDALRLCEWQSERLHHGYCLQNAIISGRVPEACATMLNGCTEPNAVSVMIVDCVEATLDPARSCEATVAEVERCTIDLHARYARLPSCEGLTEAQFREVLYSTSPPSCVKLRCPPP
jgi:hypothetical protein